MSLTLIFGRRFVTLNPSIPCIDPPDHSYRHRDSRSHPHANHEMDTSRHAWGDPSQRSQQGRTDILRSHNYVLFRDRGYVFFRKGGILCIDIRV